MLFEYAIHILSMLIYYKNYRLPSDTYYNSFVCLFVSYSSAVQYSTVLARQVQRYCDSFIIIGMIELNRIELN
jgi:uncharacterized membrane protein